MYLDRYSDLNATLINNTQIRGQEWALEAKIYIFKGLNGYI